MYAELSKAEKAYSKKMREFRQFAQGYVTETSRKCASGVRSWRNT